MKSLPYFIGASFILSIVIMIAFTQRFDKTDIEIQNLKYFNEHIVKSITKDTERSYYITEAAVRIQEFHPYPLSYRIATIIWEVSEAYSPTTEFNTWKFAHVLEAIGKHESGYKKTALSKSGVPGPWQVSFTLSKALSKDPLLNKYLIAAKKDLMDYDRSAWYAGAAFSLFLNAYDNDLDKALLAWHDGEGLTNGGRNTAAARYLRDNVKEILERNME